MLLGAATSTPSRPPVAVRSPIPVPVGVKRALERCEGCFVGVDDEKLEFVRQEFGRDGNPLGFEEPERSWWRTRR